MAAPGGGPATTLTGVDCNEAQGADKLLCLIQDPYSGTVSSAVHGECCSISLTAVVLVPRRRLLGLPRYFRPLDDPPHSRLLAYAATEYYRLCTKGQICG